MKEDEVGSNLTATLNAPGLSQVVSSPACIAKNAHCSRYIYLQCMKYLRSASSPIIFSNKRKLDARGHGHSKLHSHSNFAASVLMNQ